jgi:hypothetical protein
MIEFHDKRNLRHFPVKEDYETPLTRASLTRANQRFRQTGVSRVVGSDREKADRIVKDITRERRKGKINPGNTVGEYLEFLNSVADST